MMPKYYSNNFRLDFLFQLFLLAVQNKLKMYLIPRYCITISNETLVFALYYYRFKRSTHVSFLRNIAGRYYKLLPRRPRKKRLKRIAKKLQIRGPINNLKKYFMINRRYKVRVRFLFRLWKLYLIFKIRKISFFSQKIFGTMSTGFNAQTQNIYFQNSGFDLRYGRPAEAKRDSEYVLFKALIAIFRFLRQRLFFKYTITHVLFIVLQKRFTLSLFPLKSILYKNKVIKGESQLVYAYLTKNVRHIPKSLRSSVHIFNYALTFFQPKLLGYTIIKLMKKTRKHTRRIKSVLRIITAFRILKMFIYGFRLIMRGTYNRHGRTHVYHHQRGTFLTSELKNPVYYFSSPFGSKFGVFNIRLWLKPYTSTPSHVAVLFETRYIPLETHYILPELKLIEESIRSQK